MTLPLKVGARRHFRRHMATSRPASHGEFAGLGGWAPRSKGCLDVDCRKETPTRRCSCDVDADAFGELRPPSTASVHVAEEHRSPPFYAPQECCWLFSVPTPHGSGVLSLVDGLAAVHVVTGHLAGRAGAPPAAHIEASAGRAVAAAFPHPRGRPGGQGAVSARGRGCVHSPPPFPLRPRPAGPTPFPPFSCPAVLWLLGQEQEYCAADRGQGAWQPSLRSGRLRRPARAVRDSSRRRTPCPPGLGAPSGAILCLLVGSYHQQASSARVDGPAVHFADDAIRCSCQVRSRAGRLTAFGVRGSSRLPMRALKSSRYFRTGRRIPPTQPHSASAQHCRAVQSPHWFGCMFLWWTRYAWPRRHTHLRLHAREGSHPARHDIKHPCFYLFENSKCDILFTRRRLLWKTNP